MDHTTNMRDLQCGKILSRRHIVWYDATHTSLGDTQESHRGTPNCQEKIHRRLVHPCSDWRRCEDQKQNVHQSARLCHYQSHPLRSISVHAHVLCGCGNATPFKKCCPPACVSFVPLRVETHIRTLLCHLALSEGRALAWQVLNNPIPIIAHQIHWWLCRSPRHIRSAPEVWAYCHDASKDLLNRNLFENTCICVDFKAADKQHPTLTEVH